MDPHEEFEKECAEEVAKMGRDREFRALTREWIKGANNHKYSYHFEWMGRPIIQYPQDIVALQELIWRIQPEMIIETGIARGGSLVFSASMLELNAACGGPDHARVVGIDVDIREHNKEALDAHPLRRRMELIEGSSIADDVVSRVSEIAGRVERVLVILDSNHSHEHVLGELRAYGPLVSLGSYCVVFDTIIAELPDADFGERPWGVDDNPKTAVSEYLHENRQNGNTGVGEHAVRFDIDEVIENKLAITVAPGGYLKRVE